MMENCHWSQMIMILLRQCSFNRDLALKIYCCVETYWLIHFCVINEFKSNSVRTVRCFLILSFKIFFFRVADDPVLLEYNAASRGNRIPTFRDNIFQESTCSRRMVLTFSSLLVTWCTNRFNGQQFDVLRILYLCVLYLSENKQRLVPLTA